MKSVEVIVPHFNGTHHIECLLNSIPDHSWLKTTIIDDHSSGMHFKELTRIVSEYESVRLMQVPSGKKGPGVARNIGVAHSKADWVLFADVDDFFVNGAFESIDRLRQESCDIIFFPPTSEVRDSDKPPSRHKHYEKLFHEYIKHENKKVFYKFYAPWSKLISRSFIKSNDIQFDDGVGGEDNLFSLKAAFYAQTYSVCRDTVYCVVESKESMTSNYSNQVLINHFNAMSRYNDFLQKHGEFQEQAFMLGWIVRGRQISLKNSINWLKASWKKKYPLNPLMFFF